MANSGIKGENYYYSNNKPPYHQRIPGSINRLLLRESVVCKLLEVNSLLDSFDLELFVFDCFRPFKVQNFMYDHWFPNFLKKIYPEKSNEELNQVRDKYTAKGPKNEQKVNLEAPPPHSTGAAIDLTLKYKKSPELLFMGTIFDEVSEASFSDHFEIIQRKRLLSFSEEEALKNRRLLYWIMKEAGFENYPYEWWHFSWGDQMWASLSNSKEAYYSYIKPQYD